MNPMVPGLQGAKMSSSDPNSKIDFLDPPAVVRSKIKKAFCEEGNITENGLLAFTKTVLIPISELRIERSRAEKAGLGQSDGKLPFAGPGAPEGTVFSILRDEKYGGPLHFATYNDLEEAFKAKEIHPGDLKKVVGDAIIELLEPIQKAYQQNEEWQKVTDLAYPPEVKQTKAKKVRTVIFTSISFIFGSEQSSKIGKGLSSTATW